MSPTSADRRARRSSPWIHTIRRTWRADRTKSSGCRCAVTIRITVERAGARSICRCHPRSGTNSINFGSDPTLAFDSRGNLFYGYIVVFFGNGAVVNGTEMAVARSTDGGKTYPAVTFFGFEGGSNHFNDKPMITADQNLASPYRD